MKMQIQVAVKLARKTERLCAASNVAESGLCGLLHYIAELAGENLIGIMGLDGRRLIDVALAIGAPTLDELAASHGADRQAVVCRELTKIHEEIRRGTLAELAAWAGSGAVRGEITLVVAGLGRRGVRNRGGAADGPPHRVR